jgi:RNAse (barnase) inhibitor barstar
MNPFDSYLPVDRVLDFSRCNYYTEFHDVIRRELELPEWYGCNYDAFWDSLTGIMYVPANISVVYKPITQKERQFLPMVEKIVEILREAEEEYHEIVVKSVEIEL